MDADLRALVARLERTGLAGPESLVAAAIELSPAEARTNDGTRQILVRLAQAVVDRLLLVPDGAPRCRHCKHPRSWHGEWSPRPDDAGAPSFGRCSPPASRVSLTKAGGMKLEKRRTSEARTRVELARAAIGSDCSCVGYLDPVPDGCDTEPPTGPEVDAAREAYAGDLADVSLEVAETLPARGARGRFVRRGRGPEPEGPTPPDP